MPEHKLTIRQRFNDLSRHPAHRFEAQHGISGIAGDYIFPDGMTASAYEDLYNWQIDEGERILRHPGILDSFEAPERRMTHMPGRIAAFVELQASSRYKSLLHEGWRRLEEENPELKKLAFNRSNGGELYNALLGVTSGFNMQDIDLFLKARRTGQPPGLYIRNADAFRAHMEWMQNNLDACERPHWIPSLPTLEKIRDKLSRKQDAKGI